MMRFGRALSSSNVWIIVFACILALAVWFVIVREASPDGAMHGAPGEGYATGFCCVQTGQACIGEIDVVDCADQGALVFSREKTVCSVVCAFYSPTHASPAVSPR